MKNIGFLSVSTKSIDAYMKDIKNIPTLSREEEHILFKKYREEKDKQSFNMIIWSNLQHVVSVAKMYHSKNTSIKIEDLLQEGSLGLLKAVESFDYTQPVRFVTYAVYHIKSHIKQWWVDNFSVVRIATTKNDKKLFFNHKKLVREHRNSLSNSDVESISKDLNVRKEDVREMEKRLCRQDVPVINRSAVDEEELTGIEIEDTSLNQVDLVCLSQSIDNRTKLVDFINLCVEQFSSTDRYIIQNRMLSSNPKTYKELGEHFGISLQAVQQREYKCVKILKNKVEVYLKRSKLSLNELYE